MKFVISMRRNVKQTVTMLIDAHSATDAATIATGRLERAEWEEWYTEPVDDLRVSIRRDDIAADEDEE